MELTSKQVTLRTLTPSEGKWLTEAADVPALARGIYKAVNLATSASESDYKEIDDAEKAAIEQQQEEARKAAKAALMGGNNEEGGEA